MVKRIKTKSHEEWLNLRKDGIGASEVGTIMLANEYQTPYMLWRRKKGLDETSEDNNEAIIWGHLLEDDVAQRFAMATGAEIIKASAEEWLYYDEEKPFMRVSPDRLFYEAGEKHTDANKVILECKTSLVGISEDNIPASYFCQVQYQMHVMEIHRAVLAWMNLSNRTFGYKWYIYDEDFCNNYLVPAVEEFWTRYIIGDEHPDPSTVGDINRKFPRSIQGSQKVATDDEISKAVELAHVKAQIKAIESSDVYASLVAKETELKNDLKMMMEDNENLVTADGRLILTYKSAKDEVIFDEMAALEKYPELKIFYKTKAGNRTMLLKIKA